MRRVAGVVGGLAIVSAFGGFTLASPAEAGVSNAVYRWGGYRGGAGAHTNQQSRPTPVPGLSNVSALAAGNLANYALETNGEVFAWGNGRGGELGNGTHPFLQTTPVQVSFPAGTVVTAIAEGNARGYAIDSTGRGWTWGAAGALCRSGSTSVPKVVPGLPSNVVSVAGASGHVLWLTSTGDVFTCDRFHRAPTKVATPGPVAAVSAGNDVLTLLLQNGQVWDWGSNVFGQLGNGTFTSSAVPVQVQLPVGTFATQIYAGGDDAVDGHQVAVLNTGVLVAWGAGKAGQLGNGHRVNEPVPVTVALPAGVVVKEAVAGGSTSYVVDTNGNVWAWGNNNYGELGIGGRKGSLTPVVVDTGVSLLMSTAANVADYHG